MKSYEINIICDTEVCDSIETSDPAGLQDAEDDILHYCIEQGWEIQGDAAVCPDCIDRVDGEQHETREDPIEYLKRTQT